MGVEIIAELATAHGGDVSLACDMVAAAADSGAHTVKIQSYTLAHLNPADPQREWLEKAHLDEAAHGRIIACCEREGVKFLSTPFDRDSLLMLIGLGQQRFKVPSTGYVPYAIFSDYEAASKARASFIKSWPWGIGRGSGDWPCVEAHLTAIPLYPSPIEAVYTAPLLDGWSDHVVGTAACKHMISKGARIIEAHFCLPGRSRQMPWDKAPEQFKEIRDWSDTVTTMTTGVSTVFRERWCA